LQKSAKVFWAEQDWTEKCS